MSCRSLLVLTSVVPVLASATSHPDAIGVDVPLIPRTAFSSQAAPQDVTMSPDGDRYVFIAPLERVPNLWMASVGDDADDARPLTRSSLGVFDPRWTPDGRRLLFLSDNAGDERFRIQCLDLDAGSLRPLTPGEGERATIEALSAHDPDHVIVSMNDRVPERADLYRIDLVTGERVSLFQNDAGYVGLHVDRRGRLRLLRYTDPSTGDVRLDRLDDSGQVVPLLTIPFADARGFEILGFHEDGDRFLALDAHRRDTYALVEIDVARGTRALVAAHDALDVVDVALHPRTGAPIAYAVDDGHQRWHVLDPDWTDVFDRLESELPGRIDITAFTGDGSAFSAYRSGTDPASYVLVERMPARFRTLVDVYPALDGHAFTPMRPETVRTRDGHDMTVFVVLPHGADADGNGRPDVPVPTIVLPHGGPWDRSRVGFDLFGQWLANRGYAVILPNYRGSTGRGKARLNAGNRQWGRRMTNDIVDAADWAVTVGIADRERMAVMGASVGGYFALRVLTTSPERFACAVSSSGSTSLITLYDGLPEYWRAFRREYLLRVGDATTDAGRAELRTQSPLFDAAEIRRPLLIMQGKNDSRVPVREAEQMVAAMTANDVPVTYLLFEGEGHGLRRPANDLAFRAVVESFLAEHLGGRAEPIGDDLEGSSLVVPVGTEHVEGLAMRD